MSEAKSTQTKTAAPAAAGAAAPLAAPPSFRLPGQAEEPETITALYGEEGEDPLEVGFVGTKPKDPPAA